MHVGTVMTAAAHPDQALARHAVVIAGARIEAIVPVQRLSEFETGSLQVHDHGSALISPGFVDAHVHLGQVGLAERSLDLNETRSLDDVLDRLRDRAAAQPDGVLIGMGWDDTRWPVGARAPSAADLDAAAPGRLVYLARVDVHSAVVSSALARVSHDAAGRPAASLDGWAVTGIVERAAHHAARDAVNAARSRDERRDDLASALTTAAARGLVGVHELGAPHLSDPDDMALLDDLAGPDRPTVTTYWGEHADTGGLTRATALGCAGAAGDLSVDGAIGSRTAALTADYLDAPGRRGSLYLDVDSTYRHLRACTLAGRQAGFHCIGDAAVGAVLAGLRRVVAELGAEAVAACGHRLEHLELWPGSRTDHVRLASELAECGVVASVQPEFDGWWGGPDGLYERRLGRARASTMNPFGLLQAAGVTLAFGSDAPVTPLAPWAALRAAVHHHQPTSRIGSADALAAHSVNGWSAAGWSPADARRRGTLAPGHAANLAVWNLESATDAIEAGGAPTSLLTLRDGQTLRDADPRIR